MFSLIAFWRIMFCARHLDKTGKWTWVLSKRPAILWHIPLIIICIWPALLVFVEKRWPAAEAWTAQEWRGDPFLIQMHHLIYDYNWAPFIEFLKNTFNLIVPLDCWPPTTITWYMRVAALVIVVFLIDWVIYLVVERECPRLMLGVLIILLVSQAALLAAVNSHLAKEGTADSETTIALFLAVIFFTATFVSWADAAGRFFIKNFTIFSSSLLIISIPGEFITFDFSCFYFDYGAFASTYGLKPEILWICFLVTIGFNCLFTLLSFRAKDSEFPAAAIFCLLSASAFVGFCEINDLAVANIFICWAYRFIVIVYAPLALFGPALPRKFGAFIFFFLLILLFYSSFLLLVSFCYNTGLGYSELSLWFTLFTMKLLCIDLIVILALDARRQVKRLNGKEGGNAYFFVFLSYCAAGFILSSDILLDLQSTILDFINFLP